MGMKHSHINLHSHPRGIVQPFLVALLLASFTFVICFLRSFLVPRTPILLWGDQVGFFDNGSRIVLGELPYRDYFQIVPPGTDLTYAVLIKCFGLSMWIPNLVMACLAASTALLITLAAERVMRGPIVALPGLLFTGFILPGSFDGTHHWFSTIAVMGAMLLLMDGNTSLRVATAGLLCGLAGCFTQSKGALALTGFVAYLAWDAWQSNIAAQQCWRKCIMLLGAATAIFVLANTYFVWIAGFRRYLFCLLTYPLRYYSAAPLNSWRVLADNSQWHGSIAKLVTVLFVYSTVPTVYLILVCCRRRRKEDGAEREEDSVDLSSRVTLLLLTGVAMFLAVAASPSLKRLSTVSPPALILLGWLLSRPRKINMHLTALLTASSVAFALAIPIRVQTRWHSYLDLPGGRAALLDPDLWEEYRWALEHTCPGQYFFGLSPLYAALHLRNPAPIEGLHPSEYTRPEQVAALVQGLEKHHVPLLILRQSDELLTPTRSPSDHLEPFRTYVLQNYRLARTFPTKDDVWQRISPP
jgi:hypothetical protein